MTFHFESFQKCRRREMETLDENYVDWLVHDWALDQISHCRRLSDYYYNPSTLIADSANGSPVWRQAQEMGLPARITGRTHPLAGSTETTRRKEVVIENDIAWRIDTLVDFLFGKSFQVIPTHADGARAQAITQILETVFQANGAASYFQSLALLGSIYGFVDVILRWDKVGNPSVRRHGTDRQRRGADRPENLNWVLQQAQSIILEAIEAPRCLPILNTRDYTRIDYYIQHFWQQHPHLSDAPAWSRDDSDRSGSLWRQRETHEVEIISPDWYQRYSDLTLMDEGPNPLGCIPVVHIQNMAQPLKYEGRGDVEPLIPLQDELNTRLCDRAHRIALQSFKMYLGKGIDGFVDRPVGPGQMWATHNAQAAIEEFGGDSPCPSETEHIDQIREALEKASGVASIAAGILKGRVGNLTSAVALKITLMGVLAKTERKRQNYGRGIQDICRLILLALDRTGIFPNDESERQVSIIWPDPLPQNKIEQLQEARMKLDLGIDPTAILKELGYNSPIFDPAAS